MPNTFGHIGVQGPITRALFRNADPRWILLGCIVPDVPWIVQRTIRFVATDLDAYDLRLTMLVRGSLLLALILSAALALLSARPRQVFIVLGLGSFMHLILDALQIKWANGVHLLAPLSWQLTHWGLFWPESWPTHLLTAVGIVALPVLWWRSPGRTPLSFRSPIRLASAAVLLGVYVWMPFGLAPRAEAADNHFVHTLRNVDGRPGKPIELDRAWFDARLDGNVLITFAREEIRAVGDGPDHSTTVSVRGHFVDAHTIRIDAIHDHGASPRDALSMVALVCIALAWVLPDASRWRRPA